MLRTACTFTLILWLNSYISEFVFALLMHEGKSVINHTYSCIDELLFDVQGYKSISTSLNVMLQILKKVCFGINLL